MDFSAVHIHLAINHSPLFGEVFAFCLAIFGLLKGRREFVTAGLVVAIIAALCGIVTIQSGDRAADYLTKANPPIAGVDTTLIREHDLAAGYFLTFSCITGGLAIIALFIGHRRGARPRWLDWVLVFLMLDCTAIAARTALLGGRIHHQEVRSADGPR
jgi:DMSO reductase anchor subunit